MFFKLLRDFPIETTYERKTDLRAQSCGNEDTWWKVNVLLLVQKLHMYF